MADGACVGMDPELWFPKTGERSPLAVEVCAGCPVREPCLEWALKHEAFGIWGGVSEVARKRLRRSRRVRLVERRGVRGRRSA